MPPFQITLAAIPFALQCVLLARMRHTGVCRHFPLFFAYVLCDVLATLVLFPLWRIGAPAYRLYFYSYWTCDLLRSALAFAVLWEIVSASFRSYPSLERLTVVVFRTALAALVLLGVVLLALHPAGHFDPLVDGVMAVQRSVRLAQAGVVLGLLLIKAKLGLAWRDPLFGIAAGFALCATPQLVMFAVRADLGPVANAASLFVIPVAYNLAVLTWTAYLWSAGVPRRPALDASLNASLLHWDRALAEALQR